MHPCLGCAFCSCYDYELNNDFVKCRDELEVEYLSCLYNCNHDTLCMSTCHRTYDENIMHCPCQPGCPSGCPCPNYDGCISPTTTTSTTATTSTSTTTTTTTLLIPPEEIIDPSILILNTAFHNHKPVLLDINGNSMKPLKILHLTI